MLFWSTALVECFKNSPISEPPAGLFTKIFHHEAETVVQFAHRVSQLPPSMSQLELQRVSSLSGLTDTKVGLLSLFHDNAVYKHGYGSEEAELMAHVWVTLRICPVSAKAQEPTDSTPPWTLQRQDID